MEIRRTVPIKPDVTDNDADLLHGAISKLPWTVSHVGNHAWQGDYKTTGKDELQYEIYVGVQAKTQLQSDFVQNARNKTADAIQGTIARAAVSRSIPPLG